MNIEVFETKPALGAKAAQDGAIALREALAQDGEATIVVATGLSQFEMLAELVQAPDIDWGKVTAFHMDEYAGMSVTHPASFRKYLRERFVTQLPQPLAAFHEINGDNPSLEAECRRLKEMIQGRRIAICFAGIGENGHLAFNDPPADFDTEEPYIVVDLDDKCRRQQLGEGWFPTLNDVPTQAISISIRQIMKCERIIVSVPDQRKAQAVKDCLTGGVSPLAPASILQRHPGATIYLDTASASLLP